MIENIFELIYIIYFISLGIFLILLYMYYCHEKSKLKKEYIKNLNEHDKAVILEYEASIQLTPKSKKKTKKNEQNKNM